MSTPTPAPPAAEVAREAFQALAEWNFDRFAELTHEDVVVDILPVGERRGRTAVRGFFEELREAMPNAAMTLEDVVGDDRRAAVEWRLTGTFDGKPFEGIAPTHRRIDLAGMDFVEVEAGRIRHDRVVYDGAAFARQVGMLPARGSAADRAILAVFNARTHLADRWHERRHHGDGKH